ncbi:MAG TPA: hypothetical protein VF271_08715 [Rhodanobacteraceae bacterium]
MFPPLQELAVARFETPAILKKLAVASRKLAELKGVAASIPNQGILSFRHPQRSMRAWWHDTVAQGL